MLGIANTAASARQIKAHSREVQDLKARFKTYGLEFTIGFVAAHNKGQRRWWIKFREFIYSPTTVEAARAVLKDAGIDSYDCGKQLHESVALVDDIIRESVATK